MVSPLSRKLLRDLWHLRGPLMAVILVVACGVAAMVSMGGMQRSLVASQRSYYATYRFADLFAPMVRAPRSVVAAVRRVPGVRVAEGRVTGRAIVQVPGLDTPATAHLISVPDGHRPEINDLYLRRGRWFDPERPGEVIVSEAFADANGLGPGAVLPITVNGHRNRVTVIAVALSPEFVYEVPPGSLFPDNRRFGVFWMRESAIAPSLDLEGAYNEIHIRRDPGVPEAAVRTQVDALLAPYGGTGVYGRDEHLSHRFLSDEIAQHKVSAVVIGYIFLGVAAFLLNLALSRLVATQRDQIAILKAFGYRNRQVASHYLQLALAPVLLGAVLGVGAGIWFGRELATVFGHFYRFPLLRHVVDPGILLTATATAGLGAVAGAMGTVRRTFRLAPAEALRPDAPLAYRAGLGERIGAKLRLQGRMMLRALLRRPLKTALSLTGLSLAVAILVLGRYFEDALEAITDVEFQLAQRQDATVTFHTPVSRSVQFSLARIPGVLTVEPVRTVAVRLRAGDRSYRTGLQAYPALPSLRRLVNVRESPVWIPEGGIVLTAKLAELLRTRAGDRLTVEILEGNRRRQEMRIMAVFDTYLGTGAFIQLRTLNRLLMGYPGVTTAHLAVDAGRATAVYDALAASPAVATVTVRSAMISSFEETIAESMAISTRILMAFAIIIAGAVVYNGARIALSERARELASLRVLGFTRREVSSLLFGEQAMVTLAALPVGFLAGYGLAALIPMLYDTELLRLPLTLRPTSFAIAGSVVILAASVSGWLVRRRIDRLDLITVLKTRE